MESRDIFDLVLVVLVTVTLFFEAYGSGGPSGKSGIGGIVATLLNIDTIYYLVVGGILGVAFVSYITIYLPQKYSNNAPK